MGTGTMTLKKERRQKGQRPDLVRPRSADTGLALGSHFRCITLSALLLCVNAATVWAGPPLLTDDPGTPGDGNWEINLASAVEYVGSETLLEAPILDINYGLGERVQLKFEIPWLSLFDNDNGTTTGLGNSEIGIKYRFVDEDRHGVSISTYPQVSWNNPTSSVEQGLVDPGTELFLPIQIARGIGPVELGLELGYARHQYERDEWVYGFSGAWRIAEYFKIVGEIHGVATWDFGDDILVFNIGGAAEVHDNVAILFSAGRSLKKVGADDPKILGFAGLQLNL